MESRGSNEIQIYVVDIDGKKLKCTGFMSMKDCPMNEVLTIEGIYFIEWFTLTENVFFTNEHKSHAGSEELSLLSYINQQYVSRELVQNMIPSKLNVNWREIDPIERKTEYLTENGVFYNADKYDINIGREIAEYVIDHMIEEVKKIVSG